MDTIRTEVCVGWRNFDFWNTLGVCVIGTFSLIMDSIYSIPEYYSPKLKHKESTKHQPEPTYRNDSLFTDEEYDIKP